MHLQDFRKRFRATRPFTLTRAGWVFILYTIGVGAGAINTGNNLLYLAFGVFLGLIIASGALSDMSLWSLDAETIWPRSVPAGAAAMVPVRVTNRKRLLPSICVTLELAGELRGARVSGRAYLPYLAAGKSLTLHVLVHPESRGWFQARSVRFNTRYPFGLLYKRWTAAEAPAFDGRPDRAGGMFVYPPPRELDRRDRPSATVGAMPAGTSNQRGEGDSVYGLREFRDADSPRRIDWKASAKRPGDARRAWLVRETERDRESEVALNWDAPRMAAFDPARRESAARFGMSLLESYLSEGHRVRFYVTGADGRRARVMAPAGWDGEPEREFLSLWDPGGGDDAAGRYLSPADAAEAAAPAIDVLAAFDAARAA